MKVSETVLQHSFLIRKDPDTPVQEVSFLDKSASYLHEYS